MKLNKAEWEHLRSRCRNYYKNMYGLNPKKLKTEHLCQPQDGDSTACKECRQSICPRTDDYTRLG